MKKRNEYTHEFKMKVAKEYYEAIGNGEVGSKVIIASYGKKIYLNLSTTWAKQYRDAENITSTTTVESKYAKLGRLYIELDAAMTKVKSIQEEITKQTKG